jgi:hypothetical protein
MVPGTGMNGFHSLRESGGLTGLRMVLLLGIGVILPFAPLRAMDVEVSRTRILVETDPIPYALGGVNLHLGVSPSSWKRLEMGLSVIYGLDIPRFVVEMNAANEGKGFDAEINQGAGIWTNYRLSEGLEGWFVGLQLFTQELAVTRPGRTDEINRTNLGMVSARLGYRWIPGIRDRGFYIAPWAGGGYQFIIPATFEPGSVTPETTVGGEEYRLSRWMPFVTVHIGWAF